MFNQPVSESGNLTQKLEDLENIQAQERDKLDIANKNMGARFNELESMMKTLLAQVQGEGVGLRKEVVPQYDPKSGVKLGIPGTIPKWGGGGSNLPKANSNCFYCGGRNNFVGPECEEMKEDIRNGLVKMSNDGKIRLSDGSYIPNVPNAATIKERVEKYYAKKMNQFYCGSEEDHAPSEPATRSIAQYANISEDPARRRARLEYELGLKEREEALELKQLKLEREEKRKAEQGGKTSRTAQVMDILEQLTEEEVVAIKPKAGFY